MVPDIDRFLAGAICFGHLTIALLFLRFWRKIGDRLFLWFFAAFVVLASERIIDLWAMAAHREPWGYVMRLVGFACIIFGVVDRNRRSID